MTDDWEQRVAAALELQQRPRRPVWRIIGVVVATMVAAYVILSMAFNAATPGAGAPAAGAPIRANTTFGLDAAQRNNAPPVETIEESPVMALDSAPPVDDSARLFEIRNGISAGVRQAYENPNTRPQITRPLGAAQPAPRISEDGEALETEPRRSAPPLPAPASVGAAGTTAVSDASDAFETAQPDQGFSPSAASNAAITPAPATVAATPSEPAFTVLGLDDPVLIDPIDGPAPRAPRGVWVEAPGPVIPVELTVTPDGSAIDITPAAGTAGTNPILLSAAVIVVENSVYPPLQGAPGTAYRAVHMVQIPPSQGAVGAIAAAQPAATAPFNDPQPTFTSVEPLAPPPARTTTTVGMPVWRATATSADFEAFYPRRALRNNVEGKAMLGCVIDSIGALRCRIVSETPQGYGFGEAALEVSRSYVADDTLSDGTPASGRQVNLPIDFALAND